MGGEQMANVKVRVPQKTGEITVAHAGDKPVVYEVSNGTVSVPEADVGHFLAVVNGAEEIEAKAAPKE